MTGLFSPLIPLEDLPTILSLSTLFFNVSLIETPGELCSFQLNPAYF